MQTDQTLWWNKVATMDDDEMDMLPYGFVKKYGTFAESILNLEDEVTTETSKLEGGRWDEVRNIKKLLTNQEKAEILDFKQDQVDHGINNPNEYDHSGYMSR